MLEAIKPLLDSGIINEETETAINEAWEAKLSEAKETVRAELREEFAQRYEHDKSVMVEALDKMVNESLTTELQEFAEDKKRLAEDRVKFNTKMSETADKFKGFLVGKLTDELKELREWAKLSSSLFVNSLRKSKNSNKTRRTLLKPKSNLLLVRRKS